MGIKIKYKSLTIEISWPVLVLISLTAIRLILASQGLL